MAAPDATPAAVPLQEALTLLPQLLDLRLLDEWQPTRSNAVYTSAVVVWLLIYQRLHPQASLAAAVSELIDRAGDFSTNKRVRDQTLSSNTGAYSRARSRLQLDVAEKSADHVFAQLSATTPATQRATYVLDGTTIHLPSHPDLRTEWPPASNQHGVSAWPVVHLVMANHLDSGWMVRPEIGAMYGKKAAAEVRLARPLLSRIPPRSLLMADRNFGVFDFVFHAVQAGHDVLTRLSAPRFRSMVRGAEPLDEGRWKFRWRPTAANRKSHPELPADAALDMYLFEFVGRNGQTMWVASTLDCSVADVADRYYRRWEIETDIRSWKHTLGCDGLRCHTADMVRKEIAMSALAYNLVVEVRRLAAQRAKVSPKRISFAGVWSLVAHILFSGRERTAQEWEEAFEMVVRGAAQRKLPNRPNRHYPRQVLPRGRRFPERPRNQPE